MTFPTLPARFTSLDKRLRMTAAAALVVAVIAALATPVTATATPPSPTASDATTAAPATSVRRVTLLTRAGHLRSRYTVTSRHRGRCWTTSSVNGRLYRCFRGNLIEDPCWKLSGHHAVVCLSAPWRTKVTRLRLTRHLPATDSYGPAVWGLRVGDGVGVRCLRSQGASGTVGGKGISYFCQRHWALLEEPDRSTPLWTIDTARRVNGRYVPRGRHHLTVAWRAVVH